MGFDGAPSFAIILMKGVVTVAEGIVTLEGVYVVRYFLGGSGCCVAESKEFQVHIYPALLTHKVCHALALDRSRPELGLGVAWLKEDMSKNDRPRR